MKENKDIKMLVEHISHFMKCPNCGANYDVENVQYLGKVQVFYVVQMFCERCSIPVFASVLIKDKKLHQTELSKKDKIENKLPVNSNDIIDFHSFINSYKGDFKTLLS